MGQILQSFENSDGVCQDEQIVRMAGIVEAVKMKTTRNNTMMAYITLEDDTGAMELLVFSSVIAKKGDLLKENTPIVVEGRLSVRDEKAPQMVVNQVYILRELVKPVAQKLYLKLPGEGTVEDRKTRAILNMFPGSLQAVLYYGDSGVRRGTNCSLREDMLQELRRILGDSSVVLK